MMLWGDKTSTAEDCGQLGRGQVGKAAPLACRRVLLRIGLFVLAAVFIVFGALRGEVAVILQKAVLICLECIGLG